MKKTYDVLIVGGGTAGSACAYIAGKLGLKVLLVESKSYLGGAITSSLVVPAMKTSQNSINTTFFTDLYDELYKLDAAITYSDGNKGWFNPEIVKIVLDKMMNDANVDILYEHKIKSINKKLSSYTVSIYDDNLSFIQNGLLVYIETNNVVDATGDAKILKNFFDIKLLNNQNSQPINLRFIMSGVDSVKFVNWIMDYDKNRNVTTSSTIGGKTYFSTAYTWDTNTNWALKPIFQRGIEEGVITEDDSNYFQVFSIAGTTDSVAFNCPRLLNNDSPRSELYIQGRASILRISQFCKKYLPGFESAYISHIADSLGVRVSNRVQGKYIYTCADLYSGKKFEHPVVVSNYPVDVHSDKKNSSKLTQVYQEYQLPLESLIVDDNLFVIGRCISAEFEAQAALRIIPSCFSMGEGLAKHIAQVIKS